MSEMQDRMARALRESDPVGGAGMPVWQKPRYDRMAEAGVNQMKRELDVFFPPELLGEVIEFLTEHSLPRRDGILLADKLNSQCGASARRRLS
jgi:hypothetical protein